MLEINGKNDRIGKYLKKLNRGMLFDELSDSYLEDAGIYDILHKVPVPITGNDFEELTTLSIGLNMGKVIGSDTSFKYTDSYVKYMKKLFGDDFIKALISEGAKVAGKGNFELGCAYFRAALVLDPKSRDALYLYGRACKDAYENEDADEDYVGSFKAESLETFELLTMIHKDYAMGFYFLGYAYANLGLYIKANLTWDSFMQLTLESTDPETQELRTEIAERLNSLETPVVIEQGCNCILSGKYQDGISILGEYINTKYNQWWPLWYYLGTGYEGLNDTEEAIKSYKTALQYSPSNTEILQKLVVLCEKSGDVNNAVKYQTKIKVVSENMRLDREEASK